MGVKEILEKHMARQAPAIETFRRAAFAEELRSVDEASRVITFVASTEDVDRYGDIIRVKGWDTQNYQRNPVFLFAHDSSQPPIGKCISITKETSPKPALVQKIQFADAATYPFADSIFKLYKGGFMNSVSVGFRPMKPPIRILDSENNSTGGYEFVAQELLELSAVPIPANPAALARALTAGVVLESDVSRVFATDGDLEPRQNREADFARAILGRAAGRKVPELSDEDAVKLAFYVAGWWELRRGLVEIQASLPYLPAEVVAVIREKVIAMQEDWDRLDLQDAERDFLAELADPKPQTVDSFLETLEM